MGENISTRVAYGKALAEFGTDEKLFVFDADLKKCTMTLYFAEKYPERFFNIGIAEANMVDIAAGFATCGATALVHTFAIFATGRTYDQIRNSVCYPGLNVKIVGSHGGLTVGEDGATHQALEDISLMRGIPGMTVIIPCDSYEARLATKAMLEKKGPCYFRTCRPAVECVTDQFKNYNFEIGKGVQLTEGTDVTIIACGIMVQEALKAQKLLEEENIYARVIDMHTIKPIDTIGGLGSAVAEVLVQTEIVPVEFVGVQDQFGHSGSPSILLKHYGLCSENIVCKAKKVIERK